MEESKAIFIYNVAKFCAGEVYSKAERDYKIAEARAYRKAEKEARVIYNKSIHAARSAYFKNIKETKKKKTA